MTLFRGYLGTIHRDGLAGSWGGHAVVSWLCVLAGVLLAWVGPSWWAGAAVVAALAYLVVWGERSWPLVILATATVGLGWGFHVGPLLGGALGGTVALAFYAERERANKRSQQRAGTYTETARLDHVGDLIGAAAACATSWTMYLAGYLAGII